MLSYLSVLGPPEMHGPVFLPPHCGYTAGATVCLPDEEWALIYKKILLKVRLSYEANVGSVVGKNHLLS